MNEQEIEQVYNNLMVLLRDSQYSRIARDVQEQIEEGYIKKEKVKIDLEIFREDDFTLGQERRNTKSTRTLYRRFEYSSKEKLLILIAAIEAVLVNPIRIRAFVVEFFHEEAETNIHIESPVVTLYPSVDESIEPLTSDLTKTRREIESISGLIKTIDDIRKALGNGNSE